MDVIIEKWATVEINTDDEEEAIARAEALDSSGGVEYEQSISMTGDGSKMAKMETALRLIATIHMTKGEAEEKLAEAQRIAKRAIP